MNTIVVGCGRVGAELAYLLFLEGHHVAVVDELHAAFEILHPEFRGRTIAGDVLAKDTLHRAGIEHADGLAAVTPSDSVNAVVAHVAHSTYHVPHVVVRNYDPRHRPLLEAFGVQIISPSSWGARRIEEVLTDSAIRTVFSLGNGEVEMVELVIPVGWNGKLLGELLPSPVLRPIALTRAGLAMQASVETVVSCDDVLHISTTQEGRKLLRQQLQSAQEA
jgi:trk system potassium uptake protein